MALWFVLWGLCGVVVGQDGIPKCRMACYALEKFFLILNVCFLRVWGFGSLGFENQGSLRALEI